MEFEEENAVKSFLLILLIAASFTPVRHVCPPVVLFFSHARLPTYLSLSLSDTHQQKHTLNIGLTHHYAFLKYDLKNTEVSHICVETHAHRESVLGSLPSSALDVCIFRNVPLFSSHAHTQHDCVSSAICSALNVCIFFRSVNLLFHRWVRRPPRVQRVPLGVRSETAGRCSARPRTLQAVACARCSPPSTAPAPETLAASKCDTCWTR